MFFSDRPIVTNDDDFLGNDLFAAHLGHSLSSWEEKDSLVVGLYGGWGEGKSSVINLAINSINLNKDILSNKKPTIIEFNPWLFSDFENLNTQFFKEISKQIELKDEAANDKALAGKLSLYSDIMNVIPKTSLINNITSKAILILALFGFSIERMLDFFNIPSTVITYKNIAFIIGFVLLFAEIIKDLLKNLSSVYSERSKKTTKTAFEVKNDIKKCISERDKKILIIIDDIDRLNESEIRHIFQLVKINADFPNTIYLLSFDRNIVEQKLGSQNARNGSHFIEKIVQIHFDMPKIKKTEVERFLLEQIQNVFDSLPASHNEIFEKNHWMNIYHSGLKHYLSNIRDVKRYINCLKFTMNFTYQGNSMEMNPIDFLMIEALRVFDPFLYNGIKKNRDLLTEFIDSRSPGSDRETYLKKRNEKIQGFFNPSNRIDNAQFAGILVGLFPQLSGVINSSSVYDKTFLKEWENHLRVCSPNHFNAYFMLTPCGDSDELSQFQKEEIFNSAWAREQLKKLIDGYFTINKISKVVELIFEFRNDVKRINTGTISNYLKVFFTLSDDFQEEHSLKSFFEVPEMINEIAFAFFRRNDFGYKKELLYDLIREKNSLFSSVMFLATVIVQHEQNVLSFLTAEEIQLMKEDCLKKIKEYAAEPNFFEIKRLSKVLKIWCEWGKKTDVEQAILRHIKTNDKFKKFIDIFIYYTESYTLGEKFSEQIMQLDVKTMSEIIGPVIIMKRLSEIQNTDNDFYKLHQELFDLFTDRMSTFIKNVG